MFKFPTSQNKTKIYGAYNIRSALLRSCVYKLYNPIIKKMIVLRDVQFDEEQVWDLNSENQP
jgi:hypothetical protein